MTALRVAAFALLAGCRGCDLERMIDQPRYGTYEDCEVCPDGTIMMAPPAGTVSRTADLTDEPPDAAATLPVTIDRALLARGENRFDIFCAACHGRLGDGDTQVAENMQLRRPPNLHEPPYSTRTPGRVFRVITHGYGLMRSYANELPVHDRWAVVAYLEALRLSQHVDLGALSGTPRAEATRWLR